MAGLSVSIMRLRFDASFAVGYRARAISLIFDNGGWPDGAPNPGIGDGVKNAWRDTPGSPRSIR